MQNLVKTPWLFPNDLQEAILAQKEMAEEVIEEDALGEIREVCGIDVSNNLKDPKQMIYASAVVVSKENFQVLDHGDAAYQQKFPYIPGFLGFREVPCLVEAVKALKKKPKLIFVDGHGVAHPRGLGIASHLGVVLDIPTIGVAKKALVGKPEDHLAEKAGSFTHLIHKNKVVAIMLRPKPKVNPLIISVGHKVSLETAFRLVQTFLHKHKLPEPTRLAHNFANKYRKLFL